MRVWNHYGPNPGCRHHPTHKGGGREATRSGTSLENQAGPHKGVQGSKTTDSTNAANQSASSTPTTQAPAKTTKPSTKAKKETALAKAAKETAAYQTKLSKKQKRKNDKHKTAQPQDTAQTPQKPQQPGSKDQTQATIYSLLIDEDEEEDTQDNREPEAGMSASQAITITDEDNPQQRRPYRPTPPQHQRLTKIGEYRPEYRWETTVLHDWHKVLDLDDGITTPDAASIAQLLGGKRTKTPANGNCQFQAITQTLLQQQTLKDNDQAQILTPLVKQIISDAFIQDAQNEAQLSSDRYIKHNNSNDLVRNDPKAMTAHFKALEYIGLDP